MNYIPSDLFYRLALEALKDANKGNPFISKKEAMSFLNESR